MSLLVRQGRGSCAGLWCLLAALCFAPPVWAAAPQRTFTVLTFNLRARHDKMSEREVVIARELKRLRPDIALFQEVAPPAGLQVSRVLPPGYTVVHKQNSGTGRGLAIAARHPITRSDSRTLPGGRPALMATVTIGGRAVNLVNVHLRPQLNAGAGRAQELAAATDWLRELGPDGLLGGDFNFGDKAPEERALAGLRDVFRARYPRAPGLTWDIKRNPLAAANGYKTEPSRRLDRLMLHGRLAGRAARIVMTRPFRSRDGRRWMPSDHFGLISTIRLLAPLRPPRPHKSH